MLTDVLLAADALSLGRLDFRLMNKPSYIYFKMLNCACADVKMIRSSMQAPVLYHAMLYGVTAHHFGMSRSQWRSMPCALLHERKAIILAQEELTRNHTASEDLVFATALMALTEVSLCLDELES